MEETMRGFLLFTMLVAGAAAGQSHDPELAPAFDHAALHVSNLERSTSFYATFGLKRIADPFHDDRHVWLGLGAHEQLHLLSGGTANPDSDMSVHIAIRVRSIPALTARLDLLEIVYYNSKREAH